MLFLFAHLLSLDDRQTTTTVQVGDVIEAHATFTACVRHAIDTGGREVLLL